ncbi:uncharacterized protein LOC123395818 isoform X2 [Hordeum vulgare subsp. vulgare]|uniref:uncharacterized protein LOC123395818 isoform X2 n=1 Tax=Hordeum vulgare subsp. vulgare TaxID=112509 RepID=UPI001D1A385E|nr:uncharacterized protein LOC123395818 isoform X2 [Hordeum vulgare subsp. vulgare]
MDRGDGLSWGGAQRTGNRYATLATPGSEGRRAEVRGGSSAEAERTAKAQMQSKIKRRNTQGITYFGLVWKKSKSDTNAISADDVILGSKDGVGSSMKPICCLCRKRYSPDLMYIRCERCRNWFHGDALRLEEARIAEVISYRCCRCRRRAIPGCPHSDDYYHKRPEPEPVIQESAANIPSSEEAISAADENPSCASFGRFEHTVEEIHADSSVHMETFVPGSNQEMNFVDGSYNSAHSFDKIEIKQVMKYGGFRVVAAESGSLYERIRQGDYLTNDEIMGTLDKLQKIALHQMKDIASHGIVYSEVPTQSMHNASTSTTWPSDHQSSL